MTTLITGISRCPPPIPKGEEIFPASQAAVQAPVQHQPVAVQHPSTSSQHSPPGKPGKGSLILVQIDGLGHKRLQEAIEKGYAPHLADLLKGQEYRLASYLCGIPTVTMAVQTAIFYGKLLPGNEWYSKVKNGEEVANVKEREFPSESGLLHGGRAYLSELSGGATKGADVSRIFMEEAQKKGKLRAVLKELSAGTPLFLRYLLVHNPLVSLPAFCYHLIADARKIKKDLKARGFTTPLDQKAPFFLSLIGNLWSNVAMEGLKKAARKKTPVAYADFSNYDELAHYYGPSSREAFQALKKIDAQVGEVIKMAKKKGSRLVIFSDHGQTPTNNFIRKFQQTPQQMVDAMIRQINPRAKEGDVVFSHVYSMGNIYLKGTKGHLNLSEIQKKYPGFVMKLAGHPGIGMVAVREDNCLALFGKGGFTILNSEGKVILSKGKNPLFPYLDQEATGQILAAQLKNYMKLEESGDLVIFAPYENGTTIDYNHKYTLASEHGGIGGEQMHPFVIWNPASLPLEPEKILDARDLHTALKSIHP